VRDEAKKERKRWLGGEIHQGKRGPVFHIDRWLNGRHYHFSTKCRTERAALKELERFEQSPETYRFTRGDKTNRLEVTPQLIGEYLEWMKRRDLSAGHIAEHERYLQQFMVAMAGRDLRRIGYPALRELIEKMGDTARWNRVKAIKSFASFLRKHKGVLPRGDDPTLDLLNPIAAPEKTRRKKAMPLHIVEYAISKMRPEIADIAIVLAATGIHISELIRFHAGEGELYEPTDWQRDEGVLRSLVVKHKKGKFHAVAITDEQTLAALQRIRARPAFPHRSTIGDSDRKVSEEIGVKFSMGWLRHSVATWLAMRRVSEQDIANQLGHTTTKMARSTYIDLGMSAHAVPIPRLKLVKG